MRYFFTAAIIIAGLIAGPAGAQLSQSGGIGGGNSPAAPGPHGPAPDVAPPALPGADGTPGLATAPVLQKPAISDPTQALFAAVNAGNYNDAQDAVSRGADINAQNALGETPLDLSIALNRNTITFMLLSARNEGGETAPPEGPVPAAAPYHQPAHQVFHATPARIAAPLVRNTAPGNAAGTPNASAGFLGFGQNQ